MAAAEFIKTKHVTKSELFSADVAAIIQWVIIVRLYYILPGKSLLAELYFTIPGGQQREAKTWPGIKQFQHGVSDRYVKHLKDFKDKTNLFQFLLLVWTICYKTLIYYTEIAVMAIHIQLFDTYKLVNK